MGSSLSGKPTVPPCYCITGHGRSGTSFIAEMLQSAGLDIGQRLMGPGAANPRGHFEDMEFHEFHVAVLKSHGFGDEGYLSGRPLQVQQQLVATAQEIVQRRHQAGRPWGWKEPRSTLFLDFWREQVPELRFLLLFRRPWDVIDSLFRRGDPNFHQNPNLAVQVWLNYNQVIIDFYDRFPERCLLIESHAVAREPRRLTEAIVARFGDHFGPIGDVYEDRLFHHEDSRQEHFVLAHFFPETITLYEQLRTRAALVCEGEESGLEPTNLDWALQHWIDFRRLETLGNAGLRSLRAELDESQRQLRQAQADVESLAVEIRQLRVVLGRSESERDALQARLSNEREPLSKQARVLEQQPAWAEVEKYRTDLVGVESERDALKARLAGNEAERDRLNQASDSDQTPIWHDPEASRFSRLRRFWHRVRGLLRRHVDRRGGQSGSHRVPIPARKPWGILPRRRRRGGPARNQGAERRPHERGGHVAGIETFLLTTRPGARASGERPRGLLQSRRFPARERSGYPWCSTRRSERVP